MKRVFILLLSLTVMAVAFTGCSSGFGSKGADKFSTTYLTEVKSLNPYLLLDTTALTIAANTQDGLIENDRFGRYVPSLAESWTSNKDFTVWTFKLRKGIKWSDWQGKATQYEVTADNFVDGLRYVADPKNGIKNVGIIRKEIKGLNDYYYDLSDIDTGAKKNMTREQALANFDKNVGVKAIDKDTVQYTMEKPTPYFLSYLTTELFLPVDKKYLESVGAENYGTSKENMLYTGAYTISDWQRDKSITLTKNDNYWDKDNIKVKTISIQKVSDDAIGAQMFQRGEISSTTLQADQVKALQGSKMENDIHLKEKSSVNYWFSMNFTSQNPEFKAFINNLNFRKALYYGIDGAKLEQLYTPYKPEVLLRKTITPEDVLYDNKGVDYTDYPGLKEIKNSAQYNPSLAKQYMDKAIKELVGPDGRIKGVQPKTVDMLPIAKFNVDGKLPLQFVFIHSTDSTDTKLAQLLAEMLKTNLGEKNVDVVIGQYTNDKYNECIEPRKFDLEYDSFSFKYADPMAQLGRLTSDGSVNDGQYKDAAFDKMVNDASAITDIGSRYAAFSKAEKYLIDNVYVIPWAAEGGSYEMSKAVPFTEPKGGFGLTRFKYKGMVLTNKAITNDQYKKYEDQYKEDMKKALEGK